MFAETIGPTRTEPDFVAHIAHAVATDPDVPWVFVVDCLNVHWSASLVEWIAKRCEPDRPLGKKVSPVYSILKRHAANFCLPPSIDSVLCFFPNTARG